MLDHLHLILSQQLENTTFLSFFWAYLGGVLTSFTPCVYPLIPITVSIIGVSSPKVRWNVLNFVLGISVTYSTLGLLSGLSGQLFGSLQNNAISYGIVSIMLIIFAAWTFEWIHIPIPRFLQQPRTGTFLAGLSSGLIVAPCTLPVLGTLLTMIYTTQNSMLGFFLMFVFSLGLCTLIVIIGLFSSTIRFLPKSGPWLIWVKTILGVNMIALAAYYGFKALNHFF